MTELQPQRGYEVVRKRVWDELVHLHEVWSQYLHLYGHGPERVQLLNESARWFFASLQRLMIREAMMCIARLTDPPKSRGKENLVLTALLDDPLLATRHDLKAALAEEIEKAKAMAEPIRKHRNRYIAHLDHATAIGAPDDPIPSVTRSAIEQVIQQMESVYHRHSMELYESDPSFDLSSLGGVRSLVSALERGQKWRQHEIAEMKRQFGVRTDSEGTAAQP